MMNQTNPRSPLLLGYSGLIPIVIPTILLFVDIQRWHIWLHLLLSYAAIILSFIGALHWAYAMTLSQLTPAQRRNTFVWSVIPALVAWVALSLNPFYALLLMAVFFVLAFVRDYGLAKLVELPRWYMPLRLHLTIVLTACLLISAIGLVRW
jgi:uncharacterized membrane protein